MTLELHGFSMVGREYEFSLHDVRNNTSFWIYPNDPAHADIVINSFSPRGGVLDLTADGREMQLTLKGPSVQPMAVPPATPPLVVYSPFYTGPRGPTPRYTGVPAPIAAPAAAPTPARLFQLRRQGYVNSAGNPNTGGGYGGNGYGGNRYGGNNGYGGNAGYGTGPLTPTRRQIAQPVG
jgi:hypothetical protein